MANPSELTVIMQKQYPLILMSMPAQVAQVTETQCTPIGMVYRRSRGFIPGSAGTFRVWIPGAHALRLISWV